jgi:hypothetical protein
MKSIGVAVATVLLCNAASATPADDVLKAVIPQIRSVVNHKNVAPAAWSTTTRGGAFHFADEFAYSHLNGPMAGDLADGYYTENQKEHEIASDLPEQVLKADVHAFQKDSSFDWTQLSEKYPRAKSVVLISEPAFDSLGTTALVRYDVVSPEHSYTSFVELERQALDGSWKSKFGTMGTRDATYRTDGHPGHMPNHCPVPADKRHS